MSGGLVGLNEASRIGASRRYEATLSANIQRLGARAIEPAELPALLAIVLRACDAVARMHALGQVHGALTPSCVVLGLDGEVSVRQRGLPPELASVAYYSTEQAWGRSHDLDARTDVHSFGGMLFLILALRAPHACDGDAKLELASARTGIVRQPQAICPERVLPRNLCRITMRALAASPSDRHPSLTLFKQDVERFVRSWVPELPIDRSTLGEQGVSIARGRTSLLL